MKRYISDEAKQIQLGKHLGQLATHDMLIYLQGDLGTGKTTLARGFLHGLGHQGRVKSPTYTLVEIYTLKKTNCYHLDLYRMSDVEELAYLGLRDMLAEKAILLIEWPQRAHGYLPKPDLHLNIAHAEQGREMELIAHSDKARHILHQMP